MICYVQSLDWKPKTDEAELKKKNAVSFRRHSTENPQVNKACRSFISTLVSLPGVDLKALQTLFFFTVFPSLADFVFAVNEPITCLTGSRSSNVIVQKTNMKRNKEKRPVQPDLRLNLICGNNCRVTEARTA